MKSQLFTLLLFIASFNGLNAQVWEFTSSVESWNWGVSGCNVSQAAGNLVVNSTSTANANFGIDGANLVATNVNYLVLNVKNQSAAPYFAVNLWVSIPDGAGGYLPETIKSFNFNVPSNSSVFQRSIANLSALIPNYSQNWRINRIRFDAVSQTSTSVISIDYIRFVNDAHVEWDFINDVEGWGGFNTSQCSFSQANGSLVVAQTAFTSPNINLGVGNSFVATNDNYLVLKLKNESPATSISVILWAQALLNGVYGAAFTRTVVLPITANSSEFIEYRINLTSYTDFVNSWKINNIRIDAALVNTTSRLYFDYIGFKKFLTPDAPTSVFATAGNAQASVAFAAPVNNGGSAILNYTVTSNPGNLTSTGTTSPLVVTGLTPGIAYTFTVTAKNAAGIGAASIASASVTPKNNISIITFSTPGIMSSYRPGSNADYVIAMENNITAMTSKVEFYKDNVKIAEDLTAPYEYTISNVQSGYSKIYAAAFNSTGDTLAITKPSELFVGTSKVGVRPLPRGDTYDFDRTVNLNNPGGYFADYTGKYPFVASHTDVLTHLDYGASFEGDFRTRKTFIEHYLPFDSQWIDTNPQTNPLIISISMLEKFGTELEHIIIAREGKLYGKPTFTYGPFTEDSRILYQRDVDEYRKLFKDAYEAGIVKHDNYKLVQLISSPTAFYTIPAAREIIKTMDGVCFESHQYNVHWPLETGIEKDFQSTNAAIRWTLANNLDFVFYYGPWRSTTDPVYYKDAPKDWLLKFWAAGMPKYFDNMYFYTNNFPNGEGVKTPIGPETDPDSHTGFVKWLIEQVGRQTPLAEVARIPNLEWNFDKSVERWGFTQENCKASWVNNSLVVEPIAAGSVSIGNSGYSFHMKNVEDFFVRLKNQSSATSIAISFWIAKSGIQGEEIKTFTLPITPNSGEYKTYHVNLTTAITGYSTTWRVNSVKMVIPNQAVSSKVSFDYIKFLIDLPLTQSILIKGDNLIDGIGVKKQYEASTLPDVASQNILWSVDKTNIATIDSTGLVTTVAPGEVVVSATAKDGSGVTSSKTITVVYTPVSSISIVEPAINTVNLVNDFKLMTNTIAPTNASNKKVVWSVVNGTGSATIDASGKLVPLSVGTVTVVVKPEDNTALSASKEIIITNTDIKISSITITSPSGFALNFDERLQLNYTFEPYNASNNGVIWEVIPGTGAASIDNKGLLTAASKGTVTVKATAKDGSGISALQTITINRVITNPTSIEIVGPSAIYNLGLQIPFTVNWTPANSTWKSLSWSVDNTNLATIDNKSGLLTSVGVGTVTITARVDSTQEVFATKQLKIGNQQLTTQQWNFDSSTERWDWSITNCGLTQSAGNLVVNMPANAEKVRPNFGNQTMNFSCADVNYFVIKIKNESSANKLHMWIWASTATTSEKIFLLSTPILPFQTEYKEYIMYLPIEAKDFSNGWNINRLRLDPETGGTQGMLYIDYMKFVSSVPKINSIVLSGSNTVTVGANTQMGVQILPIETLGAVRYSVSDKSIATIDAYTGVLTGVSLGVVTVTASVPGFPGISAQKDVTVNNTVVKATSITVVGENAIDGLGIKKPYSAIFTPENTTNKSIKYSVSDPKVATIDENTGMLTTVAVGDVTVIASSQDDSGVKGEKVVKVTYTVFATSISIVGPTSIDGMGKQFQYSVAFQPEATTNKAIKYTVDKPAIATIDGNGLLTIVGAGVVRVYAETLDGSKLSARIVITVKNSTSINAVDAVDFKIFPNPATNKLTISSGSNQVYEVRIVDLQGRIVYWNIEKFIGQKSINIGLEKGIYFVKLTGNVPFAAMKLVVE
jgi:uncharacterized protein YjdB